jgi:flagellar protein FliS
MQSQRLVQRYHQTQVETSNPLLLIVLAYDGILRSLQKAMESERKGDFGEKGLEIQRALDLINELWSSLDMEKGKETAVALAAIYRYASSQIILASVRRDIRTLESVYGLLKELRESWAQVKTSKVEDGADMPVAAGISYSKAPALAY